MNTGMQGVHNLEDDEIEMALDMARLANSGGAGWSAQERLLGAALLTFKRQLENPDTKADLKSRDALTWIQKECSTIQGCGYIAQRAALALQGTVATVPPQADEKDLAVEGLREEVEQLKSNCTADCRRCITGEGEHNRTREYAQLTACQQKLATAREALNGADHPEHCASNRDSCKQCGEEFDGHPNEHETCEEFVFRECDCPLQFVAAALADSPQGSPAGAGDVSPEVA